MGEASLKPPHVEPAEGAESKCILDNRVDYQRGRVKRNQRARGKSGE